jgi:3-oxoadipate enol-lactonase
VPKVIERWFARAFQERAPDAVERVAAMLRTTDFEGYVACRAAVRDMGQRDDVAAMRAPNLVVADRSDQATPVDLARLIVERVPGAKLIELDAAHLSDIEDEAVFTAATLGFLG